MRDPDYLGNLGEKEFEVWCAKENLTATKPERDRHGWDYFVEFPHNLKINTNISADMQKPPIKCFVQIKSTDSKDRYLSIKLSNLEKLAKTVQPAFYMFIQFDGQDTPQNIYLVHVNDHLVTKILKRLRELDQNEKDTKPNKTTISINYDDQHKLKPPYNKSLKTAIEKYIPEGINTYIEKKKQHIESTGFENGKYQIDFTVGDLEQMIDVSLGIKTEVDISDVTAVENRFGIKKENLLTNTLNTSTNNEGAKLRMLNSKVIKSGFVRFKEDKFASPMSFECDFHFSPLQRIFTNKLLKIVIKGKFFEFTYFDEKISLPFSFDGVQMSPLDLHNAMKLLSMLSSDSKGIILEFELDDYKAKHIILTKYKPRQFNNELKSSKSALHLAKVFNLEKEVAMSLNDLIAHGSADQ